MIIIGTEEAYRHSTQGYAVDKMAVGKAAMAAGRAEHYGLTAEIRTIKSEGPDQFGMVRETYGIFANTTEAGRALLEFKEPPSLREQVKMAWRRGMDPREYCLDLPDDYEECEGIDMHGNDIRPDKDRGPSLRM